MKQWTATGWVLGLAVATLVTPKPALGQTAAEEALARGGVELGTSLAFSTAKEQGDDESATALNLPLRVGFMVANRLELEGEVLLTYVDFGEDDSQTGVIGAAHLLYHFKTSGNTVPYLLAGGGAGNGAEYLGLAADADQTVTVLRAGAGVKTFFGPHAALRVEYRFTRFDGSDSDRQASDRLELNDHKVLVGISLWL